MSRADGLIHAGYGSRHDTGVFAVIDEAAVPHGALCDDCVDALAGQGCVVLTGHFGKLNTGLPGAAYAQIFRAGEARVGRIFETENTADAILTALSPLSDEDPFRAGMISRLLRALGHDTSGAADRYGAALEADQKERIELLTLMLDSIGPVAGNA